MHTAAIGRRAAAACRPALRSDGLEKRESTEDDSKRLRLRVTLRAGAWPFVLAITFTLAPVTAFPWLALAFVK